MQQLQNLIREIVEQGENVNFRNSYSGRCMYGRSCIGITGSFRACMDIVGEVIKELHNDSEEDHFDEKVEKLMRMSSDSMGYDMIIYWEDLESIEEEFSEEEEELLPNLKV